MTARNLPAVGGGNVETSQRIVDVVLGAFQVAAASQGTMNNLLFGDESFGFYETMGGGTGATPNGPGTDAIHSHMTNTRLTDPEILEARYPVLLLLFSIRRQSGGRGKYSGGQGMVRCFGFLKPLKVSLVTNRRGSDVPPPYGMLGGEPGKRGLNGWSRNSIISGLAAAHMIEQTLSENHADLESLVLNSTEATKINLERLSSPDETGQISLGGDGVPLVGGLSRQPEVEQWICLPASCQLDVAVGDRLAIFTPGGGGFGAIDSE